MPAFELVRSRSAHTRRRNWFGKLVIFLNSHHMALHLCRTHPHVFSLSLIALSVLSCREFFREIELEEEAETKSSEENTSQSSNFTDKTSDGPCQIEDEACIDQDVMLICDPDSGNADMMFCPDRCGDKINISCLQIDSSHHACWCQTPGPRKNINCAELETCIERCTQQASDDCMPRCFARTDSLTARLYGALLYCAEEQCHDLCHKTPELCQKCVVSARSGTDGACIVERSLCDQDEIESL